MSGSIVTYLRKRNIDILTIQEPSINLTNSASVHSANFIKNLTTHGYRATITPHTITIINTKKLGGYLSPTSTNSDDGRIQISLLHTSPHTAIAIVNVYAPQINHAQRSEISATLINFLNATIPHLTQSPAHLQLIVMGDLNICISRQTPLPNNLLHYFLRSHNLTSSIPYAHNTKSPNTPLHPTVSTGNTHIDHILLPHQLLHHVSHHHIDTKYTERTSPSDHYPCHIQTKIRLQDARNPPVAEDPPPPSFKTLSTIPVKLVYNGHPDSTDENPIPWFKPDPLNIPTSSFQTKQDLVQRAITLQQEDPRLIAHAASMKRAIQTASQTLLEHAEYNQLHQLNPSTHLIPRTAHLLNTITDAYSHFQDAIDYTLHTISPPTTLTPPSTAAPKTPLPQQIDAIYQRVNADITLLTDHYKQKNYKHVLSTIKRLQHNTQRLSTLSTKHATQLTQAISDIDLRITTHLEQHNNQPEAPTESRRSRKRKRSQADPLKAVTSPLKLPSDNQKTLNRAHTHLVNKHKLFITNIKHISHCATLFPPTITSDNHPVHKINLDNLKKHVKTISAQIKSLQQYTTAVQLNFDSSYGIKASVSSKFDQTPHPPPAANTHTTTYHSPHQAPTLTPAHGPAERVTATQQTQQQQMDLPPGKALHFVDLTFDELGANGINCHLNRHFTPHHLAQYHPEAASMPAAIQQKIIDAHHTVTTHVQTLLQPRNHTECAWPFYHTIIPTTHKLAFKGTITNLMHIIQPSHSKARLNNFNLSLLARLHPIWTDLLQSLTPIILATRILPNQLKTCGRVLIDKPHSLDKRPISILHAYDSYLDTIVNKRLSSAVESLNVLDHTIAAYRKGKSVTDLTLAHILAVQDALRHNNAFLAQLDEDKEKYFDRLSPELQLLPLHLLGFPPSGYMEWIAESLNNLLITTTTPFGTATTNFLCGVRQGSALSCTIANLVAWLTASIWVHTAPPTPHAPPMPTETQPEIPGHTPSATSPHSIDQSIIAALIKHSYCDDSSRYIAALDIPTLVTHISYILNLSGAMSIVTKLSINATKSCIRLFNPPPGEELPSFTYTAWHHTTRSVQSNPVPSVQMTPISAPYRMFGTIINHDGTTSRTKAKIFPLIKHKRRILTNHIVSDRTFSLLYREFVTSVASFNPICQGYTIKAAIADDRLSLKLLRKQFRFIQAHDQDHLIYLSNKNLGNNFLSCLVTQILEAILRELFILTNTAHRTLLTPVQTSTRAALHTFTHGPPDTAPNLIEDAVNQASSTGFFLLDTQSPLITAALTCMHSNSTNYHPLGIPHPSAQPVSNPFHDFTNSHSLHYGPGHTHHRALVASCIKLASQEDALHHTHPFSEHSQYRPHHLTPSIPLNTDTEPYETALLHASAILHTQYNHHSHFTQHTFSIHRRARPRKTDWMNEQPLHHRRLFTPHHMLPLIPTYTSDTWTSSPLLALKTYNSSTRLPSPYTPPPPISQHNNPPAQHHQHITDSIADILNTFHSPLLFSSDSSQTCHNIVATSVLMALDRSNHNASWLTLPPIPLNVRTHFLPTTSGTSTVDNNMGEIKALQLSLWAAPLHHYCIFLIDSAVTLSNVISYLIPTTKTNRTHLRQQMPNSSLHYTSTLCEALDQHFHHPPPRNSRAYPDYLRALHKVNFDSCIQTFTRNYATRRQHSINTANFDADSFLDTINHHLSPTDPHYTNDWHPFVAMITHQHHCYIRINSHQLTNAGNIKHTDEGIPILPQPNYTLAMANSWPDSISRRLAQTPQSPPPGHLKNIPQPPIPTIQYAFVHQGKTITSDLAQYTRTVVQQHFSSQLSLFPTQWHSPIIPRLSDPTRYLLNHTILKTIITDHADSHTRRLFSSKPYRINMRHKHHNDTNYSIVSTHMYSCPLCMQRKQTPLRPYRGTIPHHHTTCNAYNLNKYRHHLNTNISKTVLELNAIITVLCDIIDSIRPTLTPIPFLTFLPIIIFNYQNSPLTSTPTIPDVPTSFTPEQFTITSPDFDWTTHPTLSISNTRHDPPTLAHTIGLVQHLPADFSPSDFTALNTLSLTGLLSHAVHHQIQLYLHSITHTFTTLCPTLASSNQIDLVLRAFSNRPDIISHAQLTTIETTTSSIPPTDTTPPTFLAILKHAWLDVQHALLRRPVKLQMKISALLTSLPTYPQPFIPDTTPTITPPTATSSQTPTPSPGTCSSIRCLLRADQNIPATSTSAHTCHACKSFHYALHALPIIQRSLTKNPHACKFLANLFPHLNPQIYTTQTILLSLYATPLPPQRLRAALEATTHINNDRTPHIATNPNDLHTKTGYSSEATAFLYSMLLVSLTFPSHPPVGPELPAPNNFITHTTLIKATTLCSCIHIYDTDTDRDVSYQTMAFHATHCPECHHLIQRHPNLPPNSTQPQVCIICGVQQTTIHIHAMPCPSCTISSLLHRRTLSTWWPKHHRRHHQSIHQHFNPADADHTDTPPPSPQHDNHPPFHDPEAYNAPPHNPPLSPRYDNPPYTPDPPDDLNDGDNVIDAPPLPQPQQQITLYPSAPTPHDGYHDPIFCRSPTPHPPLQMFSLLYSPHLQTHPPPNHLLRRIRLRKLHSSPHTHPNPPFNLANLYNTLDRLNRYLPASILDPWIDYIPPYVPNHEKLTIYYKINSCTIDADYADAQLYLTTQIRYPGIPTIQTTFIMHRLNHLPPADRLPPQDICIHKHRLWLFPYTSRNPLIYALGYLYLISMIPPQALTPDLLHTFITPAVMHSQYDAFIHLHHILTHLSSFPLQSHLRIPWHIKGDDPLANLHSRHPQFNPSYFNQP